MTESSERSHILKLVIALALATLMILTRGELFGSVVAVTLHDASWAVFLLGGLLLRKLGWLAAFAAIALALDLVALCGTTSNFASCLRPSYPTLAIAWIVLWSAGLALGSAYAQKRWLLIGVGSIAAIAIAFVVSNGGFYLWSGFYDGQTLAGFIEMATPHALIAFSTTLIYFSVGLTLLALKNAVEETTRLARIQP